MASVGPINSKAYWKKSEFLDDFLARELCKGSVTLVIGAGASIGFGLPSWENLVQEMYSAKCMPWPTGSINLPRLSDDLRRQHYANDDLAFAEFVRETLYKNYNGDASTILTSQLLQAIGAFLVSSIRGSASHTISFNFDDILENYLRMLGFVVRSVSSAPFMETKADMHVLHPHGLLPSKSDKDCSKIVFTESDYDRIIGRESESWNRSMTVSMSSSTCIFIGLSGDDQRLRTQITQVKAIHPMLNDPFLHPYWAVRPKVSSEDLSNVVRWEELGVAPRELDSYNEIPVWLLSLCQKAAELSETSDYA